MKKLLLTVTLAGLLLCCCSCKVKSADLQVGFKAIIGWLLPELSDPGTYAKLLDLDSQGKVDYIVGLAKPRLEGLTVELRAAIDKGDTSELRSWCAANLPTILPLLDKYSPQEILGFVKKASPRLARTLEIASPTILNYLADKGSIKHPDWESVSAAYMAQTLDPTDEELQALAKVLTDAWVKAKGE